MKLSLKNQLNRRISKREIDIFVQDILDENISLAEIKVLLADTSSLFNLFWILSTAAIKRATSLNGLEREIFETMLLQKENESVIRNGLSIFKNINIPKELEDDLYNESYRISQSRKSPIAHRSFAILVCVKIALKYPDLKAELLELSKITLELYGSSSPGIRSSCNQAIKKLTLR
jgi:hypothetical protein